MSEVSGSYGQMQERPSRHGSLGTMDICFTVGERETPEKATQSPE